MYVQGLFFITWKQRCSACSQTWRDFTCTCTCKDTAYSYYSCVAHEECNIGGSLRAFIITQAWVLSIFFTGMPQTSAFLLTLPIKPHTQWADQICQIVPVWEKPVNFILMSILACPPSSLLVYLFHSLATISLLDCKVFEARRCQILIRLVHGPPRRVLDSVALRSLNTG